MVSGPISSGMLEAEDDRVDRREMDDDLNERESEGAGGAGVGVGGRARRRMGSEIGGADVAEEKERWKEERAVRVRRRRIEEAAMAVIGW